MTMTSDLVSPWILVNGSATLGTVELDDQALAPSWATRRHPGWPMLLDIL